MFGDALHVNTGAGLCLAPTGSIECIRTRFCCFPLLLMTQAKQQQVPLGGGCRGWGDSEGSSVGSPGWVGTSLRERQAGVVHEVTGCQRDPRRLREPPEWVVTL
jgi:hypothetical protein